MIPRVAHFVFGLKTQDEPFHFVHYLAVESCRRLLEPDAIHFHYKHLPWGPWWDRVLPHLTLHEVELAEEVLRADYSAGTVPRSFLYAHHSDFIRLDALIEHGGIYADADTVFVRPFPDELFDHPFVIGAEPEVQDELTGEFRPSLCNALLMAEPNALFARAWRERMADALNGTWSNHSGFLAEALSREMPTAVHVETEDRFFPFRSSASGISQLLEERRPVPPAAISVHLWAHLWWQRGRRDFSRAHAGWCTPSALRRARTTFAELARPYLPPVGADARTPSAGAADAWVYLSIDETSGYGVAGDRCRAALEGSGLAVDWTPFVPGPGWGLYHQPPALLDPFVPATGPGQARVTASGVPDGIHPTPKVPASTSGALSRAGRMDPVVVTHLVPEYFPLVRQRCPQAFLIGRTVWETDRIPEHWIGCLDTADLVVVPSRFTAEAVACSPVRTPVTVVPFAAPSLSGRPSDAWGGIPPEVFVFYTIAEWNERKAVFLSVEAYLRAFSRADPVLLVIKTSYRDRRRGPPAGRSPVEEGTSAWSLARLMGRHRDPPAIRLVTRELGDDDICALHRRGNCFVSLCRSEGWGLGAFDAAAHGKPVVTTDYGGQLDYLGGSPYLVDYDLVPVNDPAGFPSYSPAQRWAEPDVDHGARLLREVMSNRREAETVAGSMGRQIRWRYRPTAIATAFRAAVDAHRTARGAHGP